MSVQNLTAERIPEERLAEQWYGLLHKVIAGLQAVYRKRSPELTQKLIAARLGKRPEVVSRCLSGQKNMTLRTLHDLARAMDCRLDIVVTPLSSLTPTNRNSRDINPIEIATDHNKTNAFPASSVDYYPTGVDLRKLELAE